MSPEVWITGMSTICAAGKDLPDCMHSLAQGFRPQSSPEIFPSINVAPPACLVTPDWIKGWQRKLSSADTLAFALQAAKDALSMAGIKAAKNFNVGVCIGTTAGSALHFINGYAELKKGITNVMQPDIVDYFNANPAAALANSLDLNGPITTLTNACTSGTDAIGIAANWIEQGLCDMAIAGGADALSLLPYTGFQRLMIYSSQPCKPFDRTRDGLNLGEGAGVFILESSEHAQKRHASCLCKIKGYASASDAYHITAPHPEGRGLAFAIEGALTKAGIKPDKLAFVNAHGTATVENDKVESLILSSQLPHVPVWATKGSTGHCLGAAGAIEAVFSASALSQGVVPASVGCTEPESTIKNNIILSPIRIDKEYALSVSLGFGGVNSALVLQKTSEYGQSNAK